MASTEFQLSTYMRARLEVSESEVSTTNNTSKVTAVVKVWRTNSWSGTTSSSSVSKNLVIDGTTVVNETSGISHTLSQGEITVMSGSKVITHNTDGSKSISVSCSLKDNVGSYFTGSGSLTMTLTKIARQANITGADNFNDEGNPKITYSNPAGSSVSSLQACISLTGAKADIAYRDISKTGTSYTFNLTSAERDVLRTASANTNSLALKFYVKTVIGSNTFYSTLDRTMTVVNATPTLTSATAVDVNSTTTALTGSNTKIVKGYSNLKVSDVVAGALKKASLKSIIIDEVSETYTSGYTKTINGYTKNNVGIKVVDSRSNTSAVLTKTFSFVDYFAVKKGSITATRGSSGVGEGVTLSVSGNWFNGSFGATSNTLTASYRFKESTASSWTTGATTLTVSKSGNDFSVSQSIRGDISTGFNVNKSYNLEVTFADKLSSATFAVVIGAGTPAIAIKGNKIALGGKFDDSIPLDIQFKRCPFPVGYIYMSTSSTNPNTYFGGTWEQIKDRFLLSAGNTYKAGNTGGSATHTLTVSEMPNHTHTPATNLPVVLHKLTDNVAPTSVSVAGGSTHLFYDDKLLTGMSTGGGNAHNNMPPYLVVYMWKRTA